MKLFCTFLCFLLLNHRLNLQFLIVTEDHQPEVESYDYSAGEDRTSQNTIISHKTQSIYVPPTAQAPNMLPIPVGIPAAMNTTAQNSKNEHKAINAVICITSQGNSSLGIRFFHVENRTRAVVSIDKTA